MVCIVALKVEMSISLSVKSFIKSDMLLSLNFSCCSLYGFMQGAWCLVIKNRGVWGPEKCGGLLAFAGLGGALFGFI